MKVKPRKKMTRRSYIAHLDVAVADAIARHVKALSVTFEFNGNGLYGAPVGSLTDAQLSLLQSTAEDVAKWCVRLRSQRLIVAKRGDAEFLYVEDGTLNTYATLAGGQRA